MKKIRFNFKILIFILSFILINRAYSQLTGGWVSQAESWGNGINDIKFLNINTGITSGSGGKILKTTNSGENWISVISGTLKNLNSVTIVSPSVIFIAGDSGVILKSTDLGDSWISINSQTINNLNSIVFKSVDKGFAAGNNGTLLRTTNSGLNWVETFSDTTVDFNSISFVNDGLVWVVGQKSDSVFLGGLGFMIKTTNLGLNWNHVIPDLQDIYEGKSIFFVDSLNGYCGFCSTVLNWGLLVTNDGGSNWECTYGGFNRPNSLFFINDSSGICVGNNIPNTTIYITSGNTWYLSFVPFPTILNSAYFINALTGWVVGSHILKTTNGGGLLTNIIEVSGNIPYNFSLSQNYPNPFNPVTNIKFDIPKTSFTRLSVYNSEGKMIETLYNGELNGGSYEINFDGSSYPSGIYFYKLETDEYSFSKKMLFVK